MGTELEHRKTEKTSNSDFARGMLAMRNIKPRRIAEAIGVTDSCVGHILHARKTSRRVQQAIADALEMAYEELWGTKP